jgi:AcrR family transcriptional regulator
MTADGDVSLTRPCSSIQDPGVAEPQRESISRRARILDTVVEIVAERGFADTTVRLVTARAKVSTRTFYECFGSLEDCVVAILDETLERTRFVVESAFEREGSWQEGVRGALAGMLALFDGEPQLARVCVLEMLAAGPAVLEHRERAIVQVRALVVEHLGADASRALPLAFESTVVSVIGVIHARLVTEEPEPLIALLGPLMGLILAPYLDEQELEAEIARADELAQAILNGDSGWLAPLRFANRKTGSGVEPGSRRPRIAGIPSAARARACLMLLAEHNQQELSPSNGEIARGIGVSHKSQISELLTQLLEDGLVSKLSEGAGKRNAWRLTPRGEEAARALMAEARRDDKA